MSDRRTLFPHQVNGLSLLRQSYLAGNRRIGLQSPTGSGKSVTMATITREAMLKGNTVLTTVPFTTLVDQMVAMYRSEGIRQVGVMQGKHPLTNGLMPVQVATLQTLARRELKQPGIVLVDEFHINFKLIADLMARWPDTLFIGFSATPGTKGLGRIWQDLVTPTTTEELMATVNPLTGRSFLAPFKVYAADHPDLSGIRTVAGDYHEGQLSERMSSVKLIADAVQTWKAKAAGRPTLVFCVDRAHADKVHQEYVAAGIRAEYVDAFTPRPDREAIRKRMECGETEVTVNIGTLTTGTDWPFIACIQLCRPTKSEMLFKQIVGRGLRDHPGKDHCLVLDHSDSTQRLGFVTDIEWNGLDDGTARTASARKERDKPEARECHNCHFLMSAGTSQCPECGHEIKRTSKINFSKGELNEVTRGKNEPSKATKQLWWSGFLGYALKKQKSRAWCLAQYKKKFGVWPRGLIDAPTDPTPEIASWITSQNIAWSKSRNNPANVKEARS